MSPVWWHRRSSHDGESWPGVLAVRRSRRSRVSVRRRCVAHAPGQGEKRQTCRGRALQQEPASLRTTRSAGRAASLDGSATRARSADGGTDRKSTRLNSSHGSISYAVFCLKKKKVITYLTSMQ